MLRYCPAKATVLATEPVYVPGAPGTFELVPDPHGATERVKWHARCIRAVGHEGQHQTDSSVQVERVRFDHDGQIIELDELRDAAGRTAERVG